MHIIVELQKIPVAAMTFISIRQTVAGTFGWKVKTKLTSIKQGIKYLVIVNNTRTNVQRDPQTYWTSLLYVNSMSYITRVNAATIMYFVVFKASKFSAKS